MKKQQDYNPFIDILRIFACISIFLYHLGLFDGGYICVCSFLVISGYLSWKTADKDKNFKLLTYYKKRLLRIYLPLVIVIFLSLGIGSFIPDFAWLNIKPETLSSLFGYNNFWQISANMDYFNRHTSSPFMHLWYISFIMQFELIFPLLYLFLKKIKAWFNKYVLVVILSLLTLLSLGSFLIYSKSNLIVSYYSFFTRVNALFAGVLLAIIFSDILKIKVVKKEYKKYTCIYVVLLVMYLILQIITGIKSSIYATAIILSTLLSVAAIYVSNKIKISKNDNVSKIIKRISSYTYTFYLTQYPVLYYCGFLKIANKIVYVLLVTLLTLVLTVLINYIFSSSEKNKLLKNIIRVIICLFSLYGVYVFITSKDYTKEMKQLEEQMSKNEQVILQKQKEYSASIKEEENKLNEALNKLNLDDEELKEVIKKSPVVGIGDSVMLGAIDNLYDTFKSGYFDAKISRTAWAVGDIIDKMKSDGKFNGPVIINLGANGDCSKSCKIEIMKKCEGHQVFWVNTTNLDYVNTTLNEFKKSYDNLHIVDWKNISKNHPEYFVADKIHLKPSGRKALTNAIFDAIYNEYKVEYEKKKEKLLIEHNEHLNEKITFYGGELLLNAFNTIHDSYKTANFVVSKDYTFDTLLKKVELDKITGTISKNIILVYNVNTIITEDMINKILSIAEGLNVYIVVSNKESVNITNDELHVINFYKELSKNNTYILKDDKHLSLSGEEALKNTLLKYIK